MLAVWRMATTEIVDALDVEGDITAAAARVASRLQLAMAWECLVAVVSSALPLAVAQKLSSPSTDAGQHLIPF